MAARLSAAILLAATAAALAGPPPRDSHGDPLPDGALARFGTVRDRLGAATRLAAQDWDLTADGKTLAVESSAGLILFDVDAGLVRRRIRLPGYGQRQNNFAWSSVRFSPDGKRIVRATDGDLRVVDVATGRTTFRVDLDVSPDITFLPGSSRFAVILTPGEVVTVYDAAEGRKVSTVRTSDPVQRVSPTGRFLVGRSVKGLYLLDPKSGQVRVQCPDDKPGYWAAFDLTPDDRALCMVRSDGRFRVVDTATGKTLDDVRAPWDDVSKGQSFSVRVSPDGGVAYLWTGHREVQRRDLKAGKWLPPLPMLCPGTLIPLPDGKHVLMLDGTGILRRYDLNALRPLPPPAGYESAVAAWPSPDGRRVAVRSFDEPDDRDRLDMYDAAGRLRWSSPAAHGAFGCAWSPDSRRLACGGYDRVTFRDAASGTVGDVLNLPDGRDPYGLFFTAEGRRLVVPLEDGVVADFDLGTGRHRAWHLELDRAGFDLAPDGRVLIAEWDPARVRLFDPVAGRWTADSAGHDGPATDDSPSGALCSPDGCFVLSLDEAGTATVRDPITLRKVRTFRTGLTRPSRAAISPNGLWLAVGGRDGLLSLWDVASGRRLGQWDGHLSDITSVSFAGVGRVVTGSTDSTALLWDLGPGESPVKPGWDALAADDPTEAYRAIWSLAGSPGGPDLLRRHVAPVGPLPAERVKQWLSDLAADRYVRREAAMKDLQTAGRLVVPDLATARANATSEEARTRIDRLLESIQLLRTSTEVIHARAVTAMELAGTPAARALLAEWASGAAGARLTVDAKAALTRLGPAR